MRGLACATMIAVLGFAAPVLAAEDEAVRIDGAVLHPQSFSLADLKAMQAQQVETDFKTKHGEDHRSWTGVAVLDLLQKAGLKNDSAKNASLRRTMFVHGKDGYVVALAYGEIDPMAEGKHVILAYRQIDTKTDLTGLRLVLPGDFHPERQVHDVIEIEVK
jgi:hypothetical protein